MMRRRLIWLVIGLCLGAAAKVATAFVGVPLLFSPPVITTATGAALSTWAAIAAGVGALAYSVGLTDGSGNVFVVDTSHNLIQKFNGLGVFQSSFGSSNLNSPTGIAIDSTGNYPRIFHSDACFHFC